MHFNGIAHKLSLKLLNYMFLVMISIWNTKILHDYWFEDSETCSERSRVVRQLASVKTVNVCTRKDESVHDRDFKWQHKPPRLHLIPKWPQGNMGISGFFLSISSDSCARQSQPVKKTVRNTGTIQCDLSSSKTDIQEEELRMRLWELVVNFCQ